MYKKDYYEMIEAAGHILKRDDVGEIDIFVLETHTHNGPGCVNCESMWCHHCQDLPILPCENQQPLSLLHVGPPDPVDDVDGA